MTTEPQAVTLDRPVMRQRWELLTFIHWRIDPDDVRRRLPEGLEPDLFDDAAWVGLVPFRMVGIGAARGPAVPYLGTFWETNVRTYVTDREGRRGVWFDSLDVDRAIPAFAARATYGLPYFWSQMSGDRTDDVVTYRARRRWPHASRWASSVSVRVGGPLEEPDELVAFLTQRWRLFSNRRGQLVRAEVGHPRWPLSHASIRELDDQLVTGAGYHPIGPPASVLFSPGVDVFAARPVTVASPAR